MQHEMLLLKIYYLQMILGNLLLQIVVHLKEFPIVQWGVGSNNMFKFPISFTKNCFCAILTRNSGAYEVALIIKNKSTSTITWESWNSNGKVDVVPAECLVVGV